MKWIIVLASIVCAAHARAQGNNFQRNGRQLETEYGAPSDTVETLYASPSENINLRSEESLPGYEDDSQSQYNDYNLDAQASELSERTEDGEGSQDEQDPIKMLMNSIPGIPGEDYPIYGEAPETAFTCDGQTNGGYYADSEAECQVFHICTADGQGGLSKYSFLCPNGTIFNQEYFICDWWFNVDCDQAEELAASRNAELEAARDEATARLAEEQADLDAAASSQSETANQQYGAPRSEENLPRYDSNYYY